MPMTAVFYECLRVDLMTTLLSSHSRSGVDVEETAGTIYFDLVRSHGSMGKVSMDVVTSAGTAMSHIGPHMRFARVQEVSTAEGWENFKGLFVYFFINLMRNMFISRIHC